MATPIGTLIPLPSETRANMGFSHILRLTYADLNQLTSGTAQAVVPQNALGVATATIPPGFVATKQLINVVTAFTSSAGVITTLTLSLGDGGSSTRFVNAADLKTAAYGTSLGTAYNYAAADTIDVVATIVGQAMSTLNAGQVDIYLKLDDASGLVTIVEPNTN